MRFRVFASVVSVVAFLTGVFLISAISAISAVSATRASAEVGSKKFSKEDIKKMENTKAVIETKFGNIELKFLPDIAPNHADNFMELAKKGFYDGTVFHRVIPGFMIQGGDPKSKDAANRGAHGTGGPGHTVKAEFSKRPHKRGALSMARSNDPDSAGSQFFICVAESPFLDGKYTIFGEVVSGMDVADKIVNQPKDARDNPLERVEMKVRIIEK
ncbi:MAG: peptidylprolyl isomerase [Thermodesulfovibrionales bacterium]|nr:peptidylprolyl isomerase [Thermodesulfovibrionales bacterium]